MSRTYRARTLMGVVAIATLANGCGGGGESSTATTAASAGAPSTAPVTSVAVTSAPTAGGSGACRYVTTAQASGLAASPVKPGVARSLASGPVTFEYCDYIFDPGNAPGVTVAVA